MVHSDELFSRTSGILFWDDSISNGGHLISITSEDES